MASVSWLLLFAGCLLHTAQAFVTNVAQRTAPEQGLAVSSSGGIDFGDFGVMREVSPQPEKAQFKLRPLLMGVLLGLVVACTSTSLPASSAAPWNYKDQNNWKTDFSVCNGREQSPINISKAAESIIGIESLQNRMSYKSVEKTEIFNNGGKNVQVNGSFGTFKLPDGEYEVKQFHFHFPSEHKVDGKLGAGELHIVHQRKGASGTDGLAVVGIILEEQSNPNESSPEFEFLKQLGFGKELPGNGSATTVGPLDLNSFANEFGGGFFHYTGSLTTPPCAEKVHWYVCNKMVPVNKAMVKSFSERFPENNRVLQPPYGRELAENEIEVPGEFQDVI